MNAIEPIHSSVTVKAGPERAFEIFTERLGTWWPVERFSRAVDQFEGEDVKLERLEFQARAGGHVLEHLSNGQVLPWAEVLVWEPPSRVVLAWKPNSSPLPPTELEITFTPHDGGTLVELEHRGWERLGDIAERSREGYGTGWVLTLARFQEAADTQAA